MTVLEAKCYEQEGFSTYWPWITIIRRFKEQCRPDHLIELLFSGAREIAGIVDDVARIVGIEETSGDSEQIDLHRARFELFDSAVVDWIERAKDIIDSKSESGFLVAAFPPI